MHAGHLDTSQRLQNTLKAIKDWATTLEISRYTGSMAVHSDIAALRAGGVKISSKYVGRTAFGNRTWAYRMETKKR